MSKTLLRDEKVHLHKTMSKDEKRLRQREVVAEYRIRRWKKILADARDRREKSIQERDEHLCSADELHAEIEALNKDIPEMSNNIEGALNDLAFAKKARK